MTTIVVKIGTNAILNASGDVDIEVVQNIAEDISILQQQGEKVVLISSGAVGAAHKERKKEDFGKVGDTEFKQILSAIGQPRLMKTFRDECKRYNIPVAQGLVTRSDFASRERQLSMRNILEKMLQGGVLPILNENDFLTPEELDFSDNDQLASFVAGMLGADRLILLSNVNGLYSCDPKDPGSQKFDEITEITPEIEQCVLTEKSSHGLGGMQSKINVAKILSQLGIEMVLGNSREKNILQKIEAGENVGTTFLPLCSKKKSGIRVWLAAGAAECGKLTLDCPIEKIFREKKSGTSLLGVGVQSLEGNFEEGDAIGIYSESGEHIGAGAAKISSQEMKKNIGKKGVIFVHADSLFLL